jgi:hypothetical protein
MKNLHQSLEVFRAAIDRKGPEIPATLDLDAVVDQAQKLGLTPLCYRGLKALGISDGIMGALKEDHDRYAGLNLLNEEHYNTVIDAFALAHDAGALRHVPILLKGAHLRRTIYKNAPWARPMNDLDLLVHPEDRTEARSLMCRLGFQVSESPGPDYHRRLSHAETWIKPVSDRHVVLVDLHWRLTHAMRTRGDAALLHRDAEALTGSPKAWGLSFDHQVAHLALHLGHGFFQSGARSLVDLVLLLERQPTRALKLSDPVVSSARSSIFVALSAVGKTEASKNLGLSAFKRRLLKGLFDQQALFQSRAGVRANMTNLLRALALMEDGKRALAYPGYVASVQVARRLGS